MSEALVFLKVTDDALAQAVSLLAHEIWTEYYIPIVGKAQVEYMLETFQSTGAITRQLREEGFLYYIAEKDEAAIGYIGMAPKAPAALFLSKFYIRKRDRGKGYGKQMLSFTERMAREMDLEKISLTVNKNNMDSINAYLALGFKKIGPIIQNIGAGFFMDDYIMEKSL